MWKSPRWCPGPGCGTSRLGPDMIEKPEIIATAQALGCLPDKQSGGRYVGGCCPAGHDSDGGRCFNIYPDTQSWHCFSCGAGGDAYSLIMLAHKCDFKDALYWAKENGLIAGNGISPGYEDRRKLFSILTDAARFFHSKLTDEYRGRLRKHYGLSVDLQPKLSHP